MKCLSTFQLNIFNCSKVNIGKFSTQIKQQLKKWKPVIGLEIHAQIKSESKLFSGASTSFGAPVNSNVSFFDCATPGTLPVLNKRCVEAGVLTALALSSKFNETSLFDRKHYFYADLPSGYQITQQRKPLAFGGELNFTVFTTGIHKEPYKKSCKLKQIQLEQDSGKSLHDELTTHGRSLIDLNRAGIPLMEFVFEPELSDGEEAAALVKELSLILETLGTCSCKMEEGALRVDANISVHQADEPLGVRTEVKNIFSIRAVAAAIKYEITRQINLLENGGKIINETLSWDSIKKKTVSMRDKEDKQDYRFMPEPNLPPLCLHINENEMNNRNLVDVFKLKKQLPKMPEELRQNLQHDFQLSSIAATRIVNDPFLYNLFNDIVKENCHESSINVANVLLSQLLEFVNDKEINLEDLSITPRQISETVNLWENKVINMPTLMKVFEKLRKNPSLVPKQIVEEYKWMIIDDDEQLTKVCRTIFDENPKLVVQYKAGKTKVLRAMLNQLQKRTQGCANMAKGKKIMVEMLK